MQTFCKCKYWKYCIAIVLLPMTIRIGMHDVHNLKRLYLLVIVTWLLLIIVTILYIHAVTQLQAIDRN